MEKESEYGKKGVNLSNSSVWIQLRTTLLGNGFIVLATSSTYNIEHCESRRLYSSLQSTDHAWYRAQGPPVHALNTNNDRTQYKAKPQLLQTLLSPNEEPFKFSHRRFEQMKHPGCLRDLKSLYNMFHDLIQTVHNLA
jgi:hypothetical protein